MTTTSDKITVPKRVAILVVAFGIILLMHSFYHLYKSVSSSSWAQVEGKIIESSVTRDRVGGKVRVKLNIDYSYNIGGRAFLGDKVSYRPVFNSIQADRLAKRFLENSNVIVYVNNSNANQSVLIPGVNIFVILYPLLVVFVTCFLMFFAFIEQKNPLLWNLDSKFFSRFLRKR